MPIISYRQRTRRNLMAGFGIQVRMRVVAVAALLLCWVKGDLWIEPEDIAGGQELAPADFIQNATEVNFSYPFSFLGRQYDTVYVSHISGHI